MCFQLESEGKEESTTRGASLRAENKKRELLCIAWGRERLPHTKIGADGKGKVCHAQTQRKGEKDKETLKSQHTLCSQILEGEQTGSNAQTLPNLLGLYSCLKASSH